MLRILAFLCVALPGLAAAQSYPDHENIYVNDYAEVLDDGAEAELRTQLGNLREATGVELTVLTLHTRETWVPGSRLEDFATGLFNDWGIGNAARNDGILILVLTQDRDMRIELGSGYGSDYDIAAEYIIQLDMIPHFKEGDYQTGIQVGTDRAIDWIVTPHSEGRAPPEEALNRDTGGGSMTRTILLLFGGFVALIIGGGLFGRRIKDRFATCPQCGQRGMHTHKEVLDRATRRSTGRGERTVTCRHCNYHNATIYTIPMLSSSSSSSSSGSGGGFGGGSSSGGGASGSW